MATPGTDLYRERRAMGLCGHCGGAPGDRRRKLCRPCADYLAEKTRGYIAARRTAGLCYVCGRNKAATKDGRCNGCAQAARSRHEAWRRGLFAEVIDAYGGRCACCGLADRRFLTIDHINNDGHEDRRRNGYRGGYTFYRSLKADGFARKDVQVLCYNCNNGKRLNGGVCPHQADSATVEAA